jgi:hypothetical protein
MSRRSERLFLALVIAQAAHSVEEYVTRLFDAFAPARFLSGLISEDLAAGFIVLNSVVVLVGVGCYVGPVRTRGRAGWLVAATWVAIELANGSTHLVMAALRRGYFSGSLTAVLLVVTAGWLALSLNTETTSAS